MIYGVILAGGKGERFWPLSRASKPKQFLKLTSDKMMLEDTIDRILPLIPYENIKIVTSSSMEKFILENVEQLNSSNILGEPTGRNTCIAVELAATHLFEKDENAVLVVLSADHLIKPAEKLRDILAAGCKIASEEEMLITIGILPTRPETGYGYIKLGDEYPQDSEFTFYKVEGFTEKPKAAVAYEYYYSHNYLWNSGIFIWSAKAILNAIRNHQPQISEVFDEYAKTIGTKKEKEAREELYRKVSNVSIDVAVLENASNVLTIKGEIIWDDIGGWNALPRYKDSDSENNVIIGDTAILDSYETTVLNDADGLIACLGVSDLIIVRSGDITLVAHKTQINRIKQLLEKIGDNENWKNYL